MSIYATLPVIFYTVIFCGGQRANTQNASTQITLQKYQNYVINYVNKNKQLSFCHHATVDELLLTFYWIHLTYSAIWQSLHTTPINTPI